jgi:hypothetical protein
MKAAVVLTVEIDDVDAANRFLEVSGIPGARSAPGFASGIWTRDPENQRGLTVLVFDTRDQAEALAQQARSAMQQASPVRVVAAEVLDVAAHV